MTRGYERRAESRLSVVKLIIDNFAACRAATARPGVD
jgi:hypothetical protein